VTDPSDPREVVTRYFDAIRTRDVEGVKACFADDAVLVNVLGTLEGRDAIGSFYADSAFQVDDLDPHPGPYLVDGDRLAVEIDLTMAGRTQRVADVFHTSGGLITRLAIYMI
jgi:ketosteroid isomerase-like protein